MRALQREAAWAEERLLGDLRQSVPQNGRVHLHIIENLSQRGESLVRRPDSPDQEQGSNGRALFLVCNWKLPAYN